MRRHRRLVSLGGPPPSRRAPRRVSRWIAVLAASVSGALAALGGCTGDAVGVDACTQIEQRRCELAPACAGKSGIPEIKDEVQIQNCKDLYRDHCLVGLENTASEPGKDAIDACLAALAATTECQKNGATDMASCTGASVDDGSISPCRAFANPQHLDACRFIESAATVASSTTSSATGSGGGGGGT